jgi:hypothetical protein
MATGEQRTKLIRILIVGVGVILVVNFLVFAARDSGHNTAGPVLPQEVQQLVPGPGEVIRPQETVGADLRDDLQGQLYINGQPVPTDQQVGDPGLGIVTFRPGCAGASVPKNECAVNEFDPGNYNLRIDFWPQGIGEEVAKANGDFGSYGWSIKVG